MDIMRKTIRPFVTVIAALAIAGCASTAMKRYVGGSISEAYISYGAPENVFDLPDGRRAFQFYWGGSSVTTPARVNTQVRNVGFGNYEVNTVGTPAMAFESKGCLVTLIAAPQGNDFIVEEYRIPKRLVC